MPQVCPAESESQQRPIKMSARAPRTSRSNALVPSFSLSFSPSKLRSSVIISPNLETRVCRSLELSVARAFCTEQS